MISQLFKQICSSTGPIEVSKQRKFINFIHIAHYERIWVDISVTMLTNNSSAHFNTYAGWIQNGYNSFISSYMLPFNMYHSVHTFFYLNIFKSEELSSNYKWCTFQSGVSNRQHTVFTNLLSHVKKSKWNCKCNCERDFNI